MNKTNYLKSPSEMTKKELKSWFKFAFKEIREWQKFISVIEKELRKRKI